MAAEQQRRPDQVLSERVDAIVDAWCHAIRASSPPSLSPAEIDQLVRDLADQITGCLLAKGCDQKRIDALATPLVALRLPPDTLASLQEILVQELTTGLSAAEMATLRCHPGELIGNLTASLLRRSQTVVLEEQERIRHAYVEALRRAEIEIRLKDAAIESAITAIALWTLDGEMLYVNPAFLATWNYDDRQEVQGRDTADLWVAGDQAETIRSYLDQAGGWIGKLTAVRGDGTRFEVMLAASLVRFDGQETACVVGCFVDMTYRDRLKTMLWQQIDRLRALREIDRGILAATSLREIGEAALRHVRQAVPCRTASVVLFDLENHRARMLAAIPADEYSPFEPEARFPLTGWEGVLEALQRDEIYPIEDVLGVPLPAPTLEMIRQRKPHTYAVVPLRCEGRLLGSLNLGLEESQDLTSQHESIAWEVADSLAVAIRHAQLDASIIRHREQLRALTVRLAESDETKRRALARDLHDQIGQRLTALGINLNMIRAGLDVEQAPQLCSRLDDSLGLLSETTDRVRRVMADLRPPMLDDYGLLPTLHWCGEQLASRTGIHVVTEGSEPQPRLPSSIEDALVRIAQEALTNVAKHAKASQVAMALSHEGDRIRLTISDNGVGYDPDRISGASSPHWGLVTMTERAEGLGGHCRVESEPGEGTRVVVEVTR